MFYLAEDDVSRGGPVERFGIAVVFGDVIQDTSSQVRNTSERVAADLLGRDLGKESFDSIEPT